MRALLLAVLLAAVAGCSVKQMAVDVIGDALAEGGTAFVSDDDPELIREALPFALKTYEALLESSPDNRNLLLASARGFAGYAFLVEREADEIEATDLTRARDERARAKKLYLRGRDYALRGLAVAHEGFGEMLRADTDAALAMADQDDVPFLYWAGASWAGALSAAKDDLDLIAELPIAGALVGRVLVLDEAYDRGAAHEFLITYEGSRPDGSRDRARAHYRRALELSDSQKASVYVAFAEAVAIKEQDYAAFAELTDAALAVDADAVPELRLVNTVAQRRAAWLRSRASDLFLDPELAEASP